MLYAYTNTPTYTYTYHTHLHIDTNTYAYALLHIELKKVHMHTHRHQQVEIHIPLIHIHTFMCTYMYTCRRLRSPERLWSLSQVCRRCGSPRRYESPNFACADMCVFSPTELIADSSPLRRGAPKPDRAAVSLVPAPSNTLKPIEDEGGGVLPWRDVLPRHTGEKTARACMALQDAFRPPARRPPWSRRGSAALAPVAPPFSYRSSAAFSECVRRVEFHWNSTPTTTRTKTITITTATTAINTRANARTPKTTIKLMTITIKIKMTINMKQK